MPPLDPAAQQQIAQQQQAPPPDPYYSTPSVPSPMSGGLGVMPLPPRPTRWSDPVKANHEQTVASQAAAVMPSAISEAGSNAEIARLHLRQERIKNGLDPDTGKVMPGGDKIGDDVLKDYTPGEQNTIKAISQGRFPVTSFSMRNPEITKLVQAAMQYEPGTDLTTFQRRSAAFQKFMSNPNTPLLRVNQALQHLDRFHDNALKLDNYGDGITSPLNYFRAAGMAALKDPRYAAFSADRDALASELAAAFKGANDTSLADKEHWRTILSAANSPESFNSTIKEITGLLGGRIDASTYQFKQAVGANADRYDLMSPEARKVFDKFSQEGPVDNTVNEYSKDHKTIPVPPGYQEAVSAFEKAHPPGTMTPEAYAQMRNELDKQFLPENLRSNLDPSEVEHFVKLYNKGATPTKIPGINVPLDKTHALGILPSEQNRADLAGTKVGVGAANLGNALAFGVPELTMGQDRREAFAQASAEHPGWALGGEVLGSLGGLKTVEKIGVKGLTALGKAGIKAEAAKGGEDAASYVLKRDLEASARQKLVGDVAVNSTYGGIRGFNHADDGDGLSGTVKGMLGGAAGSVAGNFVTKGVNPLLSAGTQKSIAALRGVKTTTLQKLGLGQGEAAISDLPIIKGAREKSLQSFNRDNANRALSNIKDESGQSLGITVPKGMKSGTEINAEINDRLGEGFDRIKPKVVGSVDGSFEKEIKALRSQADTPEKKAAFKEIDSAVKLLKDENGHYDGEGYQAAQTKLRSLVQDFSTKAENGDTWARDVAGLANSARKSIRDLVARQTPEVAGQIKGLEQGWTHKMRIEDATLRALKTNNEIYSPGHYLDAVKKLDFSKSRVAQGRGFDQDYATAAKQILGAGASKQFSIRDTGIATGLAALATGSAATTHPALIAALPTVAAALYAPGIKQTLAAALFKRPEPTSYAGMKAEEIIRRSIADTMRRKLTGD